MNVTCQIYMFAAHVHSLLHGETSYHMLASMILIMMSVRCSLIFAAGTCTTSHNVHQNECV